MGFGSLHFYVFGVNSVFTVDAAFAVGSVFTVYAVLSVCTVFSVGAVNAVFTVGTVRAIFTVSAVLSGFSGSTSQLGKRHKIVPIGFIAVFPLDSSAVVSHLRQCGIALRRLAPSCGKHDAKRQKCTCE